jgi:hypothetical protein
MENYLPPINGRPVTLPTGATFFVVPGTFAEADEVLSAFLACIQGTSATFDDENSLKVFIKGIISHAFVNPRLKSAIWVCMGKCLYRPAGKEGALSVSQKLFDEVAYREDVMDAIYECAKENIEPFSKGLYAMSSRLLGTITSTLKSA